jgi:DNA-binding NtrC family response regulator
MEKQSAVSGRLADPHINCVLLSSFRSEFTFLRNVFRLAGLRIHHAESLDQADFLLTVTGSTVLLSDMVFENGSWQSALRLLKDHHPMVPMLVVAEPVDGPYLQDVFDEGAFGIVWKPFEFEDVRRQVRTVHEAALERRAWQEETSLERAYLRWADSRR